MRTLTQNLSRVQNPLNESVGVALIHGAGLGEWIWRDVRAHLQFDSLAPEFPSRHEPLSSRASLTYDDYIDHLLDQLQNWKVDRMVLVGHSLASITTLNLAQALSSRVMGVVSVGGVVPSDGGSYLSALPLAQRILTYTMISMLGTKPPDKIIERHLCNGLSGRNAQEVISRFTPESPNLFLERCNAPLPWAPCMYIKLSNDHQLSPFLQDQMTMNMDAQEQHVIHSGHLPMLSHPLLLSAILNSYTQDLISGIRPTHWVPEQVSHPATIFLGQAAY